MGGAKFLAAVVLALVAVAAPIRAFAVGYSGIDPYEEYGKRIKAAQQVSPLTDTIFGDHVSLYNGATTFEATDFSVPGNDALPVALRRRLAIQDHRQQPTEGDGLLGFGDWDIDVPYIDGTFTQQDGWTLSPDGAADRCSDNTNVPDTTVTIPGGTGTAPYANIWNGDHLHVPGAGDQELLANTEQKSPAYATAGTYKWVTTGNWKLSCISSVTNLSGEGFVAVSPAGVSYTFNYAVTRQTSPFAFQYNVKSGPAAVARVHIYLLATHVEDRFGNWVDYSYSGDHLTGISSSDGRSITLNWSGDTISSATSAMGTWTYGYSTASWTSQGGAAFTWTYLSSVTRPDGSKWTYAINSGSLITNKNDWPDDNRPPPNTEHCQQEPLQNTGSFDYSVGTPSGAMATFDFEYERHTRDKVPLGCVNDPSPYHNYPQHVTRFFDNFSLASKQVSGPGLVSGTWTYAYGDTAGSYYTASAPWSMDSTTEPYIPPGSCSACRVSKVVTVTGPASITKHTFGTSYANNEGQLLQTQVDDLAGNALKTTTNVYASDAQAAGEPFANIAGQDLLPNFTSPMGNRNRPVTQTTITQDGATFTTAINSFDVFARATSETESSSVGPGYSKTDTTAYADDTSRWVLGQVVSAAVNATAAPCTAGNTSLVSCTTYNSQDLPYQQYAFGKLVSTKAWNADGTLASVTDGNGHATTFSSWYRGLPRQVTFADGTSESATVSDAGRITSITDENGATTSYQYDPMGRLKEIDYPTGPDDTWNSTFLSFAPSGAGEFGTAPGTWVQTVQTGNAVSKTYFDAFWRPLVSEHYDSTNKAGTLSEVVHLYDAAGRTVFASYPTRSATSYLDSLPGTYTSYDALNRVLAVAQDTDLASGPAITSTEYLPGFETRVTKPDQQPGGASTLTRYMAYGQPSYKFPVSIDAPEGQTTTITRDVFGKPRAILRNGVTYEAFTYDAYQQLCKQRSDGQVTGFGYDAVGNLVWSAAGLNTYTSDACDITAANAGAHLVTRSYDLRNRLVDLAFSDGDGNQHWSYTTTGQPAQVTTTNLTPSGPVTVTNSYLYDARGLLTSENLAVPGQLDWTVGYGYDANAHLGVRVTPSGQSYYTSPDALGQATILGIQGVNTYVYSVTHYPNGHIQSFRWTNGLTHDVTQNVRGLVSEIHDSATGNDAEDLVYTYDADGNPTSIQDRAAGARSTSATYDDLDRLSSAAISGVNGGLTSSYSYDPLGRITQVAQGTRLRSYAYNATYPGRIDSIDDTQAGTTTYSYDAQGNLTQRNGVQYQFDYGNRLRSVSGEESGYVYDANGRRVLQTDATGTIASFYDNAGKLIYQRSRDGTTHDYLYLGGKLVAIRDYDTAGIARVMRYQHTDALGSIIRQTDKNGAEFPNTGAIYDAWGGLHGVTAMDGPGYTGHVQDADTGLVYMQQRYYDPEAGRFLSIDPVGANSTTGANLDRYWYASDNPYKNIDPDGRGDETANGKGDSPPATCTGSRTHCPSGTKITQVGSRSLSDLRRIFESQHPALTAAAAAVAQGLHSGQPAPEKAPPANLAKYAAALAKLGDAGARASREVPVGVVWQPLRGTMVHVLFELYVRNLGPGYSAEQSYRGGRHLPFGYGLFGTVRADAVFGDPGHPIFVVDLKTGGAYITKKSAARYEDNLPPGTLLIQMKVPPPP